MSHFFSLVRLERGVMQRRGTRDEMRKLALHGDAYLDHCLMMKLFPGLQEHWESLDQNERTQDFVFRRRSAADGGDRLPSSRTPSFYLVSRERPEPVPHLLSVDTKEFQPSLAAGERLRFQLRANPSVTRSRGGVPSPHGGKRKPNHDVLMLAKQATKGADSQTRQEAMAEAAAGWLLDRVPGWGLQVSAEALFADSYTQQRLHRGGQLIRFSTIDYTGLAEVTDPALLHKAMLEGVGRKRGFGCGLLLVRRLL